MFKTFPLAIFMALNFTAFSQNITLSPDVLTLPNVNNTNQVTNPTSGAVVYNATDNNIYYKDNVAWKNLTNAVVEPTEPVSVFLYSASGDLTPDEIQEEGHRSEIKLTSIDFGLENNINIGSVTGGGGAGKATFKEVSFTLTENLCILDLAKMLAKGTHTDYLEIRFYRNSVESPPLLFLTAKLGLVMVQDLNTSISLGDGSVKTDVVIQMGAIHYTLKYGLVPTPSGQRYQYEKKFGWSRVLNLEWNGITRGF
ncbi:type VI secretion system tube protein Hcp [Lacihabitans lacunae]|uniref:Type VI secretion system tube protein Hcp n=1 Tax=Lacihabitans lacunae TaxID=1028214 RepID=A0ABV7YTE6_9BACT